MSVCVHKLVVNFYFIFPHMILNETAYIILCAYRHFFYVGGSHGVASVINVPSSWEVRQTVEL